VALATAEANPNEVGSCSSIFGIGLSDLDGRGCKDVFNFDSVGLFVFVKLGAINRRLTIL